MWMPDWLYERLPVLYLAAGFACLYFLGWSPVAGLSVFLLFMAAILVFVQRRAARQSKAAPRRAGRRGGDGFSARR